MAEEEIDDAERAPGEGEVDVETRRRGRRRYEDPPKEEIDDAERGPEEDIDDQSQSARRTPCIWRRNRRRSEKSERTRGS